MGAILFSFLLLVVVGALVIWNVTLSVENDKLRTRNNDLLDNVTQLVSERRVRDAHGRFAKKESC